MPDQIALGVLLCWAPAVLVLARAIGPRRAALVALLGGYLLLPRGVRWDLPGPLTIDKRSVPGLSALLVVLAFDRKALLRLRPSWVDLPVLALVLAQPAGSVARGLAGMAESVDQSWINLAGWAIPYAIGRLDFGDVDGPRRVALAIAIGGLAYVPACWFESGMGPRWYLSGLLYGTRPMEGMVDRLGGHRPEVFLGNGIELAAWMATATVAASWLALCRPARGASGPPAWAAGASAVALGLTTLACRGVYGYALMAVGLAATGITLGLRTRLVLIALFLAPPAYMVARSSGAWDGRELRAMARLAGRESTVGVRLEAESRVLLEAPANGLAFGLGGRSPDWSVDGWWADSLRCGGVVGLVALYSAALVPAGLVIFGPPQRFPARSAESGLALLVVLHMLDGLHNTSLIASTPLIGGTLAGAWLARRGPAAPEARRPVGADSPARRPSALALAATLVILSAVEALGLATRTPWAGPGPTPPITRPDGPVPTNGPRPR